MLASCVDRPLAGPQAEMILLTDTIIFSAFAQTLRMPITSWLKCIIGSGLIVVNVTMSLVQVDVAARLLKVPMSFWHA